MRPTRSAGFSLKRAARTQPAEPAPTMSTSKYLFIKRTNWTKGSSSHGSALAADQVGGLFRDHDDLGIDVAADQIRHHRGIDDAKRRYAVQPQLGIDDRRFVGFFAHLAGTCGVMDRDRSIANMGIDIRIRVLVAARRDFAPDEVAHGRLRRDLARQR